MFGREKFIVCCAPERSGKGVIDCDAESVAGLPCTDDDFSIVARFFPAGVQRVLDQIAEQNGKVGVRNKNIARNVRLDNIINVVVLCLLREIEQYGVCRGIFTEANKRIVRQTVVVAAEILPQRVKLAACQLFLHERDMVPYVVLGTAGVGDFFL
mgnify:CR=1 FL=1